MKVALITDTHYGARGDNEGFHAFFEKFYLEQFFPYLVEHNIKEIIHLGDMFDRRKYINFVSLSRCRKYFFEPTREHGIKVHAIIGNHDTSYKNTNEINSPNLLLKEYTNIIPYDKAAEVTIDGLQVAFLPWICSGNYTNSMDFV
jgi:DNA repair exonuclease SbcCD nuclease subunit